MKRTIHFVAGLPRSGSTLLCNILAQNPRFHATSTSGILDIILLVRNQWDKLAEFQATKNEAGKLRVLRGILDAYHDDPKNLKPIVFDKSRAWLGFVELAEMILERKAKVLVCVRDIRDVLASFERLSRQNSATRQMPQEAENFFKWQTLEGRCETWVAANQPVGIAYNRVKDALARGYRDRMHFIAFEKLTADPRGTMQKVYQFLEEEEYAHNFDHVEQVTWEDDDMHGIQGLHTIRNKVEPVSPQWPKYLNQALGDLYAKNNDLWKDYV